MADLESQGITAGAATGNLSDRHPYVVLEPRNGTATFHHICANGPRFICLTCPGKEWEWDRKADTVTPAIFCPDCQLSGSWTEGAWVPTT